MAMVSGRKIGKRQRKHSANYRMIDIHRTKPASAVSDREFVQAASECLVHYINPQQLAVIKDYTTSEEGAFFIDVLAELERRIKSMPATYEQDGKGDEAIAYLHYFNGSFDWYITERDKGAPDDDVPGRQLQAFGLVFMFETELGYINIHELLENGVELDLHFTPTTLKEIREKHDT